jgi:modulator of FtsH protease HflK
MAGYKKFQMGDDEGDFMSFENKNGDNKDPWGNKSNQGPPDLDKVIQDMFKKIKNLFVDNVSTDSEDSGSKNASPKGIGFILSFGVLAILVIWFLFGFYTVGPAEQAVVLKLGKYSRTENPGLHWIPRLFESKYKVNIQQVASYQYVSDMLTEDENIVNVSLVVQYRIDNPKDYLFNVANPEESLKQATASALRQVIGNTTLDDVLTKKRTEIRKRVDDLLKEILSSYHTGILITDAVLQPAKPPEEVTEAFDDAIKAREDEQKFINKADAYSNQVIPKAQGQAKRFAQEADAYKQQVVLNAKAKAARFLAILPIYKQAPAVTKDRLYFDAMESVLAKSSKVIVSKGASNNLLYLPLDKMFADKVGMKKITEPHFNGLVNGGNQSIDVSRSGAKDNTALQHRSGYFD